MKRFILLFLSCIIITMAGLSQSLFFDKLKNSAWSVELSLNDPALSSKKEIGLFKLNSAATPATNHATWTFDDQLTISYFNTATGKDSIIFTCQYKADKEKGLLWLYPGDNILSYRVGIASPGNYAVLTLNKK
jgi:hypothetical protein